MMKNDLLKSFLVFTFFLWTFVTVFAQTGPAGVGNATGTNSQPHNLVWLDASDLSSFSAGNTWSDKSGNGRNAVNSGAAISLGTLNGVKALDFSGFTAGTLSIANHADFDNASELSLFVVYNSGADAATAQGLVSKRTGTGGANTSFAFFQMTNQNLNADDYGTRITGDNNALNTNYIGNYIFQASDSLKIYKNGIRDVFKLSGASSLNTISAANIQIGKLDAADTRYFKGKIAEVIIYKTNLSLIHRAMVVSYLSAKYGIAVQEATIGYSGADGAYYYDLSGYSKRVSSQRNYGPSAGVYVSLADANANDYITTAHGGMVNNVASIQSGADVTASGAVAAWNRVWFIDKSGTSNAKISFSISEAFEGGALPQDLAGYVLLRKSTPTGNYEQVTTLSKTVELPDRVLFEVADANFTDGYYTLGTLNQTASPLQGGSARTWYSLVSGDWDNWETWTLDPSGALPNNPNMYTPSTSPTAASDRVVVLNGKTVTVYSNGKTHSKVTVDGRLDIKSTSGHSFGKIWGNGRILLSSDNFPVGDATHFTTLGQGAGTVVYYGTDYSLTQNLTFFNLELDLTVTSNVLTLMGNFTVNGELRVKKGALQFNDAVSTIAKNVTVYGNVVVEPDGKLLTGIGNARHQFSLHADFTNNGIVEFTNRTDVNYNSQATNGIVDVNFLSGLRDQTAFLNGPSRFYRIEIDKGTDATYSLVLEATDAAYFKLFGYANESHGDLAQLAANNNALGLIKGTARIKSNISIPVLSNTAGNYNISEGARLWVDGGFVAKNSGNSVVPYGVVQVSAGALEAKIPSGITTRGNGLVRVEGGILTINQLRTSILGAGNVGGYVQTGGITNVLGGSTTTSYYVFNLTYPGNVFAMSGGVLNIHQANVKGGIFIASDEVNQNVTGGTVVLNIGNTNDFLISSTAPFYNLELTKTVTNTARFIVANGSAVGAAPTVDLEVPNLKVLNDFRIRGEESGVGYPDISFAAVTSATSVKDLYVGGSFFIEDGATYVARLKVGAPWYDNTTYFNQTSGTSAIETLYLGDKTNTQADFGNFILNRTAGNELRLTAPAERNDAHIVIDVNGDASVLSGTFDQGRLTFRIWGSITNYDRFGTYYSSGDYPVAGGTPSAAQIRFREDPPVVINTTDNAVFGNIRFNVNPATTVEFNSNVYVERMEFTRGSIYIKNHLLKVDYLWNIADNIFEDVTNSSTLKVTNTGRSGDNIIYTNGKASDGGLSIMVIANSLAENTNRRRNNLSPVTYPLGYTTDGGTTIYFRPAQINVAGFADDGYVQIRPVSGVLQTTNLTGGEILQQYWRVTLSDFTTPPTNMAYRFYYRNQTGIAGVDLPAAAANEANYVPGFVLDGGTYTRNYESSPTGDVNDQYNSSFDANTRVLVFNGTSNAGQFVQGSYAGFIPVNANYTAGVPARFVGAPTIYYSKRTGATMQWNNNNNWSLVGYDGAAAGNYPKVGDIAYIKGSAAAGIDGRHWYYIQTGDPDVNVAVINFEPVSGLSPTPWGPRLAIYEGRIVNASEVKGPGTIMPLLNNASQGQIIGDIGDFANNPSSVVNYVHSGNNNSLITLSSSLSTYPRLDFEAEGGTGRRIRIAHPITVNYAMAVGQGAMVVVDNNALVKGSIQNRDLTTASIEFGQTSSWTLETYSDLRLGSSGGANFNLSVQNTTPSTLLHRLKIGRNIFQNTSGSFDLYNGSGTNNNAVLELNGSSNGAYSRIAGTAPDFYRIVVNKGFNNTSSFTIDNTFTLNGPTSGAGVDKALELQNGTLIFNNAAIIINLTTGNDNFFIPGSAGLTIQQGQANASGNSGILLDGALIINGGKLDMSGGDNYIEYSTTGNSVINVSGGELIVGSQIRRGLLSTAGILKYYQTGGKVVVGQSTAPQNNRGVFEILNTGSNFTFTGGTLQISRSQTAPTFASVYLNPELTHIADVAELTFGNEYTPAAQVIGVYSTVNIPSLVVNNVNGNNPTVRQWTVPLSISKKLEVQPGTSFDANGQDLILRGDLLMNGTFTANAALPLVGNTTFVSGDVDQTITGAVTFFNLTKNSSTNLAFNNNVVVGNDLRHEAGLLIDNGNAITVRGNLVMGGNHQWGGSGDGIMMAGSLQQTVSGAGEFDKLTIDNTNGVKVVDGNSVLINQMLQLKQGVLNVGSNLLTLAKNATIYTPTAFSNTNMIQTNISFTDNGVRKIFPTGATLFTYPIGAGGKYTPVTINVSSNTYDGGNIRVNAAGEMHPSILEDSEAPSPEIVDKDNVLQYHWVLRADGVTGFSAQMKMKYDLVDVKGDINQYYTARLLSGGLGLWNKFSGPDVIDEASQELVFDFLSTDAAGVSGDYTAGLNNAIPDQVPTYISKANGNWNEASTWDTYPVSGGSVPTGGPRGSMVIVNHLVSMTSNYTSSYRTTIGATGVLSVGSTFGHRLGDVFGSGVLSLERGDLPAGFYEAFASASGGTFRFGGPDSYDILSTLPIINSLELVGSGQRRFPNIDVQMLGRLTINGPQARNEQNKKISVKGDVAFNAGTFVAGNGVTSVFELNGSLLQTVSGSVGFSNSNQFNRLTINNAAGVVFGCNADVYDVLNFSSGRLIVNNGRQFRVTNYSPTAIVGQSATRYVDGPLYKAINSGADFEFPLGNANRFGAINLKAVSVTGLWRAQYVNSSPNSGGLTTTSIQTPVQYVSNSEYWNVLAPSAGTAKAVLRWDATSGVNPAEAGLRGVQWLTDKWHEVVLTNVSGSSSAGTAETSSTISFNANGGGNYLTFGAITIPAYTWTGASSTDWFTAANWSAGIIPSASSDITINDVAQDPVIVEGVTAQVNRILMNSGSVLTLNPGARMSVNGAITNAGATISLKNTVEKPTSFLTHGTISAPIRYEWVYPTGKYIYLGHCVDGNVRASYNADALVYKVVNNAWVSVPVGEAINANPLEGYSIGFRTTLGATTTVTHLGNLRQGDYSYVLGNSWYLIGNPYPTYLDVESSGFNIGADFKSIYVAKMGTGSASYATYNIESHVGANGGSRFISPGQSFWVRNYTGTPALVINKSARTHATGVLKAASVNNDVLRMQLSKGSVTDENVLVFRTIGSDNFSCIYDSEKRFSAGTAETSLYTQKDGCKLIINVLPKEVENRTVPLFLNIGSANSGTFTLSATNMEEFLPDMDVFLLDKVTGETTNLRDKPEYTFTSTAVTNQNRFELSFAPIVEVPEVPTEVGNTLGDGAKITAIGLDNKAIVKVKDASFNGNVTIEVMDALGRLHGRMVSHTERTEVSAPSNTQFYIVKVTYKNRVETFKIVTKMN